MSKQSEGRKKFFSPRGRNRVAAAAICGSLCGSLAHSATNGLRPLETCDVVKAVFATTLTPSQAYPANIREAVDDHGLPENLKKEFAGLGLSKSEISDLAARAKNHVYVPFLPMCRWTGKSARIVEGRQLMASEFTKPLFSTDGRVAVLAWSLVSSGRWGHGQNCVARKHGKRWTARCESSWIS